MYKYLLFSILIGCSLWSCDTTSQITLNNDLDIDRVNQGIIISRSEIEKKIGKGESNQIPCLKNEDGEALPYQLDDLDNDQNWDELACVVSVAANSRITLSLSWIPEDEYPVFDQLTQVYLAEEQSDGSYLEVQQAFAPTGLAGFPTHFQAEGVGWENDKMAFRIYFDCRNTKDLFGKLTPGLILQNAGKTEFGSYHNLAEWGMDVLHCGSSLGAGGLGLIDNDSLYRLGSTDSNEFVAITEGPVRSIFELRYKGWTVEEQDLEAVERITIWAGKYWFESEVIVDGFSGQKGLVTGLVTTKLDREPLFFEVNNEFSSILLHGKQSLNNDMLAMAVLAPTTEIEEVAQSSNVDFYQEGYQTVPTKSFSLPVNETYYMSQTISSKEPSRHYVFAMWGLENEKWNSVESVKEYIRVEAQSLSNPISIEIN